MTEKGVLLKLFAGCFVNSELRMHIKASPEWKEHQIVCNGDPDSLQLVHFEDKDYLGYYLDPPCLSLKELEHLEGKVQQAIRGFFRKYQPDSPSLESLPLHIFTQAFIL